ncbi:hypothetical protein GOP47_0006456 [Adiantum capillus-veneris]|uniref:dual-specificity kinase n=1 Tax=Adiantum capillus-veneris TaxID=13818 RepID=A0A9D4V3G5_ADICA|nr:hypothetical protein GOP47_0006456 [Adiantum capillus-veneris]
MVDSEEVGDEVHVSVSESHLDFSNPSTVEWLKRIGLWEQQTMEGPPLKRRRLGWDVPDPLLLSEAARLQLHLASQLLQVYPSLASGQDKQAVDSCIVHSDSLCVDTEKLCKADARKLQNGPGDQCFAVNSPSPPFHKDDQDGHLNFIVGESLTSRYKILQKIGEGTFGRVLECWDQEAEEVVAIKVVRSAEKYREAAMIEIDVLHTLAEEDRSGSRGCVQMRRWFDYRNHECIVFERLGPSLYDFLRANEYSPFSIDLVQDFGRQLLESIAYMHNLNLIHTDLKPENVLLVSSDYVKVVDRKNTLMHSVQMRRLPKSNRIKLIDFGSTTYDRECSFSTLSTRHYRAPEVILGSGWSYPCDIWSVACIMVELCSGEVLFQTHENLEHLAMMERVFGPIPSYLVRRSKGKAYKYFRHERTLNWPDRHTTRESIRAVERLSELRDLLGKHLEKVPSALLSLLERMFCYDPLNRLTAREALQHPFFQEFSRH